MISALLIRSQRVDRGCGDFRNRFLVETLTARHVGATIAKFAPTHSAEPDCAAEPVNENTNTKRGYLADRVGATSQSDSSRSGRQ
jgi:hypothetical protein